MEHADRSDEGGRVDASSHSDLAESTLDQRHGGDGLRVLYRLALALVQIQGVRILPMPIGTH